MLIKTHFSLMCFVWCVCCVVLSCVLCLQAPEKLQTGRVVVCRSRVFGLAVGVLLFDGRKTANEIAEEVRTRRDQTRQEIYITYHYHAACSSTAVETSNIAFLATVYITQRNVILTPCHMLLSRHHSIKPCILNVMLCNDIHVVSPCRYSVQPTLYCIT
eukprot:COSAG06_NODE_7563_length_2458_cov_2.352692_1_plen_159_part_00